MAKKKNFNRQFRGGYVPDQPVDPHNPRNGHEVSSPASRARSGLAPGFQTQARPGLVGMQDRPRKTGRGK